MGMPSWFERWDADRRRAEVKSRAINAYAIRFADAVAAADTDAHLKIASDYAALAFIIAGRENGGTNVTNSR